jgi:hypothetical protein
MAKADDGVEALLVVVGAVAFLPLVFVLDGLAIRVLWGWFVVPLFNAPALSIAAAIGLGLVASLFQHPPVADKDKDTSAKIGAVIMRPVMYIAFGWLVTLFM